MKKMLISIFVLSSMIILTSCGVSPEEKEQRRANAFDISGQYQLNSSQLDRGEVSLDIVNESDRSNVYGVIKRSDFTRAEEALLIKYNINLNDVERFRSQFRIGVGRYNTIEGGENISDDMGNSSRLFISTNGSESLTINENTISYYIVANTLKSDFTLRGKLVLSVNHKSFDSTGREVWNSESVEINFSSKNGTQFSNQYMGEWSGKMVTDDQAITSAVSVITLRKANDAQFEAYSTQTSFTFNGEKFSLNKYIGTVNDLTNVEAPEVNLEYIGNKGSKIEVMGNIYSLGLFTGVVMKVTNTEVVSQIGNFQFKRK